jgi:hypothetical protein
MLQININLSENEPLEVKKSLLYSSKYYIYGMAVLYVNIVSGLVWLMVCNATFNNISVISWQSVLLVGETGVHGENQTCRISLTNLIT